MSRSIWKGPVCFLKFKQNKKIWSRSNIILPFFIGNFLKIHNGIFFVTLKISSFMLGFSFGKFISTRKIFFYKK